MVQAQYIPSLIPQSTIRFGERTENHHPEKNEAPLKKESSAWTLSDDAHAKASNGVKTVLSVALTGGWAFLKGRLMDALALVGGVFVVLGLGVGGGWWAWDEYKTESAFTESHPDCRALGVDNDLFEDGVEQVGGGDSKNASCADGKFTITVPK